MVVGNEFHSQPCLTIYYTNGQRLEGLRCCELPESVSTHSIQVQKVGLGRAKFVPSHDQKIGCGVHLEPIYQSEPCLTIQHTNGQRLEGLRCCRVPESVSTHSIWVGEVCLGHAKFVPTHDQKIGCGTHFRAHTPISALSNHTPYL